MRLLRLLRRAKPPTVPASAHHGRTVEIAVLSAIATERYQWDVLDEDDRLMASLIAPPHAEIEGGLSWCLSFVAREAGTPTTAVFRAKHIAFPAHVVCERAWPGTIVSINLNLWGL